MLNHNIIYFYFLLPIPVHNISLLVLYRILPLYIICYKCPLLFHTADLYKRSLEIQHSKGSSDRYCNYNFIPVFI